MLLLLIVAVAVAVVVVLVCGGVCRNWGTIVSDMKCGLCF